MRIWAVTERAAKREVKRLLEARILLLKQGCVRGRVASYQLNLAEVAARSRDHWAAVGPDFAERMASIEPADAKGYDQLGFVGRYVETHLSRSLSAAIEAELGPFDRLKIESG